VLLRWLTAHASPRSPRSRLSPPEAGRRAGRSTTSWPMTLTCTSTGPRRSPSSASVRPPRPCFRWRRASADDCHLHARLVFVSAFAFEGFDRADLKLWNAGDRLIETVATHCGNTVVVIHAPGPVIMERWIHHPNVTAVLVSTSSTKQTSVPEADSRTGSIQLALLPGQESVSFLCRRMTCCC